MSFEGENQQEMAIILKKEHGPRATSVPALGLKYHNIQTCLLDTQQISGERLQDHWSSGTSVCLCFIFRSNFRNFIITIMFPKAIEHPDK